MHVTYSLSITYHDGSVVPEQKILVVSTSIRQANKRLRAYLQGKADTIAEWKLLGKKWHGMYIGSSDERVCMVG